MFAYGSSSLILVHYLTGIGVGDAYVGLFMTLTLLGDAVISLCLTLITDGIGRRRILIAGGGLMSMSGLIFASTSNYWLLVLASVIGVISPSGNEVGPFKAIEESILAQLSAEQSRSDLFAWYTLFGTLGAGLGSLNCGILVNVLVDSGAWTQIAAYKVVFIIYALLGLIKLALTLFLSERVESEIYTQHPNLEIGVIEHESLLSERHEGGLVNTLPEQHGMKQHSLVPRLRLLLRRITALIPSVSPGSKKIVARLLCLFAIDSFASGLASPSWLTYFFTVVHHLPGSTLGGLFLLTNMLASVSNLLALPIARRLGPLKTMILTHLPSAVFLGLVPLPPSSGLGTRLAMGFLALRACTQSMDQAPRQAFLSAAVRTKERTPILSIVNIAKTLAQASGVGCAGTLANTASWIPMFTGAGILKATYDLLLLWMFLNTENHL